MNHLKFFQLVDRLPPSHPKSFDWKIKRTSQEKYIDVRQALPYGIKNCLDTVQWLCNIFSYCPWNNLLNFLFQGKTCLVFPSYIAALSNYLHTFELLYNMYSYYL